MTREEQRCAYVRGLQKIQKKLIFWSRQQRTASEKQRYLASQMFAPAAIGV
jgi:hypothetical protein